ncbi:hypothetical protein MTO96_043153 [Rhipicephalus appendiculatus]
MEECDRIYGALNVLDGAVSAAGLCDLQSCMEEPERPSEAGTSTPYGPEVVIPLANQSDTATISDTGITR